MWKWFKNWFSTSRKQISTSVSEPVDFLAGPRMFFALREKLQEDGLGYSQQAKSLEYSFLRNRDYMLRELAPLFRALDSAGMPRTHNPDYWWWFLDDDKVVERASRRLTHGY